MYYYNAQNLSFTLLATVRNLAYTLEGGDPRIKAQIASLANLMLLKDPKMCTCLLAKQY